MRGEDMYLQPKHRAVSKVRGDANMDVDDAPGDTVRVEVEIEDCNSAVVTKILDEPEEPPIEDPPKSITFQVTGEEPCYIPPGHVLIVKDDGDYELKARMNELTGTAKHDLGSITWYATGSEGNPLPIPEGSELVIHADGSHAVRKTQPEQEIFEHLGENTKETINPIKNEKGETIGQRHTYTVIEPPLQKGDPIDHPPHYNQGKIEPIDVIEDWELPYHLANVIKYVARCKHKGHEKEDLEKARWYLDRYIGGLK